MFEKQYKIEKDNISGYWMGYKKVFLYGWLYMSGTCSNTKEECRNAIREVNAFGGIKSKVEYLTEKDL